MSTFQVLTNSALRMPRRQQRKRRRIHNPQSLHTDNPRMRIHNRHWIIHLPHPTRTRRMPILIPSRHDILQNRLVTSDIRAGHGFLDDDGCHGLRVEEGARALERLDGEFAICGVREVVWVDEGQVAG